MKIRSTASRLKHCSDCGTSFPCGCGCASSACWCNDYPAIMPLDFSQDCRCRSCLAKEIGKRIEEFLASVPHREALVKAMSQPSGRPLIEHIDYVREGGNFVLSSWYLLKQGKCCGKGCRNCPYPKGES